MMWSPANNKSDARLILGPIKLHSVSDEDHRTERHTTQL